jgi:hypothetical protein
MEHSQERLRLRVQEVLARHTHKGSAPLLLIGDVQAECGKHFTYLYFEAVASDYVRGLKRYFMVVMDEHLWDIHYENSNVIDIDKGYSNAMVKACFKNHVNNLSKKLAND